MQKLKRLLSPQKKKPDPDPSGGLEAISPTVTSSTQPITPTSPPPPVEDPPSYDAPYEPPSYNEDQVVRLRDELQQVRLQLSAAESRSNNLEALSRLSSPPSQSRQTNPEAQRQVQRDEARSQLRHEEADVIALLRQNGFDIASTSWKENRNHERNNALCWAAANDHVEAVRYLMRNGASGTATVPADNWEDRVPALTRAIMADHILTVEILMEQATERDFRNSSDLSYAAKAGYAEVVALLLQKWPSAANSYDNSRAGALAFAAERGYEDVVRLILVSGFDLTVLPSMSDQTPLCRAAAAGQTAMVRLLLDQKQPPATTKTCFEVALSKAADKGHGVIVRMLLDLGVVTEFHMSMYLAVKGGHNSILQQLLAAGGRPTPVLEIAVRQGNLSTIQMLLDYGADASEGLEKAVSWGNTLIAELLLNHGAAVDVRDGLKKTPLHWVRNKDVAELLLNRGADFEAQDGEGKTPLYFAIMAKSPAIVDLLLGLGAGSSLMKYGKMPAEFVKTTINGAPITLQNAAEIIQLLVKHGFRFNFNAGSESKLLGLAAEHGFQNLVQVLLDNGADVDGRDNKGRTALHLAAMNGHIEIVKKLLEKGADPSVVNRFGRTAEYWAKQNGHTRVEHLLHLAKLKNQGAAQAQAKKVAGSGQQTAQTKKVAGSSQQTAAVKETKPLTRITSKPQQKDDQFTDPSVLRWD